MKELIEKLEAERVKNNWSYDKLAEVAEVAKGNVYKTLTFKSEPAATTLFKIAEALGFKIIMVIKAEAFFYENENIRIIDKEDVVIQENGKDGKVVIPKARKQGKAAKIAEKVEAIKKQNECPNCTYQETESGIRFVMKKCEEHKTKKK